MIRESTIEKEGTNAVSMWLSYSFFLSYDEMRDFIDYLSPFYIIRTDIVLDEKDDGIVNSKEFLEVYKNYISDLSLHQGIDEKRVRKYFHAIWTVSLDIAYNIKLKCGRHILKIFRPALVLQHHKMSYNKESQKFFSMVFGKDLLSFGLNLSYPQLYQDPKDKTLHKVMLEDKFENTLLFNKAKEWIKKHTRPLTVVIDKKKCVQTIRIGKKSLEVLKNHPWFSTSKMELK
jgi:hypothetical protein